VLYGTIRRIAIIILIKKPELKIGKFVEQVKLKLPGVGMRLEAQYYTNDRYDYGL